MARFTLIMPDDLRDTVRKLGEKEDRKLSAQIITLLREALSKRGKAGK